jgi:hypothetical protein
MGERLEIQKKGKSKSWPLNPKSWIVERRENLKLRNSQSVPKPLKPLVKGDNEDDGPVVASL